MKIKTLLIALCLSCTVAFAEQKIVIVPCQDGKAQTGELERLLKAGWRVIAATPVTDSDSISAFGKPSRHSPRPSSMWSRGTETMILSDDQKCRKVMDELAGDPELSQWESDFLDSNRGRPVFTDKQKEVVARLVEKYEV